MDILRRTSLTDPKTKIAGSATAGAAFVSALVDLSEVVEYDPVAVDGRIAQQTEVRTIGTSSRKHQSRLICGCEGRCEESLRSQ